MKYVKETFLMILLMLPLTLSAVPHEPSPAGGGWLELNPQLPLVQTEKPWFPDYPGPLTIEAWIYIEEPPNLQSAFSLVGQTSRFNWAILGHSGDSNFDGVPDSIGGILTQEHNGTSGMVTTHLPARKWVHYVAVIDNGVTVGSSGFITQISHGESLATANNRLIIGGVPVLTEIAFPNKQETVLGTGVYIDELRISCVLRYKLGENYTVPTKAFTSDIDTLGLYHFDGESTEHYKDTSEHRIPLIRSRKNAESKKEQLAVEAPNKLATMWGTLKSARSRLEAFFLELMNLMIMMI
ncbi:MAG: hypothetical protein OXN27_09715 [Candidatus Poribacteria bacterium]|nr:hypothetical protein [Candidatus Poribacteria bacterium]